MFLKVEVMIHFQGKKQAVNLLLKLCPKDPDSPSVTGDCETVNPYNYDKGEVRERKR